VAEPPKSTKAFVCRLMASLIKPIKHGLTVNG
jgi:hypothetical protein